jgi:diguanylate cyclase (GGDEF)-like protein/PAS domain S-box-containing protein
MEKMNYFFDRLATSLAVKLFPKTFKNMSENLRNTTASRDILIKEADKAREVEGILRRSEQFLTKVFDSIHDPFIILDRDYRIVRGNEAYAGLRNVPLIDLLDEKCHKVFHGKDRVCDDCIVEKTFRSSDPCAMDKLVRTKNGTEVWVDIYTYPIIGEDGKVSHVIEYLRDITDRKRSDKALRESEERYKRFVELSLDGIFKVNTDGDFIQMNSAGARIFGYETPGEIIGKNALEYWRDPKDRDAYREELKIRKSVSSYPMRARKKNGDPVELEASSRIIEDENGNFQGIEGILRDVTERKRMEEDLRSLSLKDDLTGLYNRRGFIALAAQELKMADRLKKGIFILYADLDGLKTINDTLGHKEGDRAIKETAIILKETFRNSDIIGRIGGDEFVIIPIGTAGDNLEVITSRLQKNIVIQNETIDRTYKLSLSVGIAYYDPENPLSIDELLTLADAGMYEQKRNKRKA